jgi:hypothetical protein
MKGQLQIFSAGRRREGSQPGTPKTFLAQRKKHQTLMSVSIWRTEKVHSFLFREIRRWSQSNAGSEEGGT